MGWRLDCVETVSQAINCLDKDSYEAIVIAVSTDYFTLFDETIEEHNKVIYMSSLLVAAGTKSPSTFRIVYGLQTEFPDIRDACFDCGADAAVNSSEALFTVLFGFMTPPPDDSKPTHDSSSSSDMDVLSPNREQQLIDIAGGVVTRRLEKKSKTQPQQEQDQQQDQQHEHEHQHVEEKRPWDDIPADILVRPKGVMANNDLDFNQSQSNVIERTNSNGRSNRNLISEYAYEQSRQVHQGRGTGHAVRVVHVSDTNGKHRSLILPDGDVFLHAGNFTDGRTQTCLEQFKDFLLWMEQEILPKFDQVAFIAGNQDFFLDIIACKYNAVSREAQKMLNKFLSKHRAVAFLENTTIQYQGLKIHGTSTTLMKNGVDHPTPTVQGGSLIRAFERPQETFIRPDVVNDECDILLTHRPPSHMFAKSHYELPTDQLYAGMKAGPAAQHKLQPGLDIEKRPKRGLFGKKRAAKKEQEKKNKKVPPRLHAFGHYGKDFGVEDTGRTLLLNGSQDRVFREDKYGGGRPLVADLPVYR